MKLVSVGDNCMDVYSDGTYYPGGNPVNVAVYFVRLGGKASYVGVVGSDKYGKMMVDAINKKNVDTSFVEVAQGKTAITQVELVNGDRVFGDYDEGVLADFKLSNEQKEFILQHDLVVTGLWGNVHNEYKELHDRGIKTAFDSHNRPYDEAPKIIIPYVDYFFYSADENDDSPELREQMKDLHSKGPKLVIVTMGANGSMVYDGETFIKYGIIPCEVVDTMGAGDSYIAGFLKGILEDKEIIECMEMGARNSSETISYSGAWSVED